MKGAAEGEIAAVGERRDDQAPAVAQVFVAVLELGVDHADLKIIANPVVSGRKRRRITEKELR